MWILSNGQDIAHPPKSPMGSILISPPCTPPVRLAKSCWELESSDRTGIWGRTEQTQQFLAVRSMTGSPHLQAGSHSHIPNLTADDRESLRSGKVKNA